jgi:serine protease Do
MTVAGFGEIAEKLRRSTVEVRAGRRGHGSGIIVKPQGVLVTNAHVATFGPLDVEMWDGARASADLVLRDPGRDLAVLRIAGRTAAGLPAATLADSDQLRVGELVIAIGNPLGFTGALTTGVVHGVGRVRGLGPVKWIQADVRLAPGNSGGPLANVRGQVVGINTMIAQGLGLAVPSNTVSRLLNGGRSEAPLGVVARPVEITRGGRQRLGFLILEVVKNSAAETASLLLGDILVGVEGHAFDSIEDFERELERAQRRSRMAGRGSGERVVRFEFLRGDRANVRTVAVLLGLPHLAAA